MLSLFAVSIIYSWFAGIVNQKRQRGSQRCALLDWQPKHRTLNKSISD